MDGQHFDRLTRSFAGLSRRGVLKGLIGLATGAAALPAGTTVARRRCRGLGVQCGNGGQCCSGACAKDPALAGKPGNGPRVCVCAGPSDCPRPPGACQAATCAGGVCGVVSTATPPSIVCPVAITGEGPAAVEFAPEATDACGAVVIACGPESGAVFPIGTTTVGCTATNEAGLQEECSFDVVLTAPCAPACADKACGADDGCGGVCQTGSCGDSPGACATLTCVEGVCRLQDTCPECTFCTGAECEPIPLTYVSCAAGTGICNGSTCLMDPCGATCRDCWIRTSQGGGNSIPVCADGAFSVVENRYCWSGNGFPMLVQDDGTCPDPGRQESFGGLRRCC